MKIKSRTKSVDLTLSNTSNNSQAREKTNVFKKELYCKIIIIMFSIGPWIKNVTILGFIRNMSLIEKFQFKILAIDTNFSYFIGGFREIWSPKTFYSYFKTLNIRIMEFKFWVLLGNGDLLWFEKSIKTILFV